MIRCGVHINLISDLTRIADECIEIKPAVLARRPSRLEQVLRPSEQLNLLQCTWAQASPFR